MVSFLAAAVLASTVGQGAPVTRTVSLAVYTKKLAPVLDLRPEELELAEEGRTREVLALEPDRRAVEVGIVVDSSGGIKDSYRSEIVPAVIAFWKALPPGTKVAVWTSAPSKVVDFGGDLAAAETKLLTIAAAGGNYGFDSMRDACRELAARGAPRRVLVYVGGGNLQAGHLETAALMEAVGVAHAVPMIVLVLPAGRDGVLGGGPSGDAVHAWDVQGYFANMTKGYQGSYVESLSAMAVSQWLRQAAADVNGQYLVQFRGEPGPAGVLKVKVNRKDTRSRVGRCRTEIEIAN